MKTSSACLAAALLLLLPLAAQAQTLSLSAGDWEELKFDNLTPNTWHVRPDAVRVESDDSVSVLYRSVDVPSPGNLRWRWRADEAPPATNIRVKGGDDRTAALTVGFAYDSANASLGERMKRVVVETVAGADAPGRTLEFVWGGDAPGGTEFQNAYTGSAGHVVVLRGAGAPLGEWVTEDVDLAALYRKVWGTEPTAVVNIALSADSDDTDSRAVAEFADIQFVR